MFSQEQLQNQQGMPDEFKPTAATLYYDAFGCKLRPIIGEASTGIPLIEGSLQSACCICACTKDELLGVAGFRHNRHKFVHLQYHALVQQFGLLSGLIRYAIFAATDRLPKPYELVMDGIAVSAAARGQGIGTQLLDALYQFAQQHGYRSIRLDVINTNPNARRLYERVGFVPKATHAYPFLSSLGFTAVTTMTRAVK